MLRRESPDAVQNRSILSSIKIDGEIERIRLQLRLSQSASGMYIARCDRADIFLSLFLLFQLLNRDPPAINLFSFPFFFLPVFLFFSSAPLLDKFCLFFVVKECCQSLAQSDSYPRKRPIAPQAQ